MTKKEQKREQRGNHTHPWSVLYQDLHMNLSSYL